MTKPAQKKARLLGALADQPLPIAIKGNCMAPLFHDGNKIMIKKFRYYLPGDIVIYCATNGSLIAHRLLGYYFWKGRWLLLIKADNAQQVDAGIAYHQVLGKAIDHPPGTMRRLHSIRTFAIFSFFQAKRKLSA